MRRLLIGLVILYTWQAAIASSSKTAFDDWLPDGCNRTGFFKQNRTIQHVPTPLVSSGVYLFACGKGLLWSTTAPISETIVYPLHRSPYLINTESIQSPIEGRAARELGKILNQFVGGDYSKIRRNFDIDMVDDFAQLKPKRRQLSKFIRTITLKKINSEVFIDIFLENKEKIELTLYEEQTLTGTDDDVCPRIKIIPQAYCLSMWNEYAP